MKTVIVDDNMRECELLRSLLNLAEEPIEFLGMAHNVGDAVALIREYEPELILLDVEMPDGTGFEVLNACHDLDYLVIFITAHDNYAIRALKYAAFDYLLKPMEFDDFHKTINKVYTTNLINEKKKLESLFSNLNEKKERRLGIWCQDGLHFIDVSDINYIKADGSYSKITMSNGNVFMATKLLKDFEFLCDADSFVRTHNSFVVNIRNVKTYSRKNGGSVVMLNDFEIPVSRGRKEVVMRRLGEWVI